MSSGGRVQLAAIGAQDIYLTSNPQMSYFIKNYKRHTMFAMQTAEAPFQQQCLFGHKARCNIPRIGDLVREVYLKVELPELNQGILKTYDSVTQKFININTYPAYCDSIGPRADKTGNPKNRWTDSGNYKRRLPGNLQ